METFFFALLTAFIWGFVPFLEKIGLSSVEPAAIFGQMFGGCDRRGNGYLLLQPISLHWKDGDQTHIFPCPCRRFGWICSTTGILQGAQDGRDIPHYSHHKLLPAIHISSGLDVPRRGCYSFKGNRDASLF